MLSPDFDLTDYKNKQDYIVSAGTKTDDNTVAPTGKLNYSKTLKYTDAMSSTLLSSDSSVKPNVDFTLQKISEAFCVFQRSGDSV